ncbi:KIF-binding protein-like [Temnothorax nylanderi]|uniref:KIF-binding protein-like n=1 Tax=Temnothorax nylanderi TaxID=102681 RepID=UPI003A864AA1
MEILHPGLENVCKSEHKFINLYWKLSLYQYRAIMFSFLRQVLEERRAIHQFETIPAEPAISMNISKKCLDVLQMSFEIKYMHEDIAPAKKINKIKATEERMNVLFANVIDVSTDPKFIDDSVALAAAYYNIGLQYVYSKHDDSNTAYGYFKKCMVLLQGKALDRKTILTTIDVLNEMNSVYEKCWIVQECNFLTLALEAYMRYTLEDNYPDPIHMASLVGIKEKESNPRIILDILHHKTLEDLGLRYRTRPKDKHIFVKYMNNLLNIRVRDVISGKTKFDEKCLDMALTLFDLSKYFLANGNFANAKSHIVIADYLIRRFVEDRLKTAGKKGTDSFHLSKNYVYVHAVSTNSWGSYGVSLLRFRMEKYLQSKENKSSEIHDLVSELEIKSEPNLIFSDSEEEYINVEITETCILNLAVMRNLADAKSVFKKTLKLLKTAKKYFTADTNIKMYAMITLKISDAYKYLAGFEEQRDEQIKLHKRRVECLEDVRKKFRTAIDDDRELQIYKRICYEVVTSCSTVMDLMVEETYYDESFKELSMKANQYAKIIAENINFYLNTV